MAVKTSPDGNLIDIDGKVRIEIGPHRRREPATKELVDLHKYTVGGFDSMGKPIVLGQPFDYIASGVSDRCWYVYRLEAVKETVGGKPVTNSRWLRKGDACPDKDSAMTAAMALMK